MLLPVFFFKLLQSSPCWRLPSQENACLVQVSAAKYQSARRAALCTRQRRAGSWARVWSWPLLPSRAEQKSRSHVYWAPAPPSRHRPPPPDQPSSIPGRGFHQRLSLKRWKLFLVPSSIHHRAEMRAADYGGNGDPDRSDTNSKYFYTIAQIF